MKFMFSQMSYFLAQKSNQRNLRFMLRFACGLVLLLILYSALFHGIMLREGRAFSPVTGLYWALTVMSTLGFGDITFNSDLGKVFSIIVLLSGVVLFMLVMPFTFIRFVYAPWLEAQAGSAVPTELPQETHGHVLVVGTDGIALSVAARLRQSGLPCWILAPQQDEALALLDRGYAVASGDLDSPATYRRLRADKAALIVALHDDMKNTNITATMREVSPAVKIAASADHEDALDILTLAGCTKAYLFTRRLGEALARRVFTPASTTNIIARFEQFCIAETPAASSPYVGKTLMQTDLRSRYGLNVVGVWQGKAYTPALPHLQIEASSTLLLSGDAAQIARYETETAHSEQAKQATPVLVLGAGRVGMAVAQSLDKRRIPFRLVEKNPQRICSTDSRYILGSASDIDILREAGIFHTHTAIVTTHDDDLNIYLTIYCRKLRPDIQIISRATLDRNVASLYNAGANLVMSHATMAATAIANLLMPNRIFMLTEGINVFRVAAPPALVGVSLRDSDIRKDTTCNVIAIYSGDKRMAAPDPNALFREHDEIILLGSTEAESLFMEKYNARAATTGNSV